MAHPPSPLRTRRRQLGLTQAELATRAGVSRQLVVAVEAGQNTPGVDAALRLARALASTVEALFDDGPRTWVPAFGGELPTGAPLRVGRVGDRLVAAELPDHGIAGAGWASPDGVLASGELTMFDGAAPAGLVLAGCDPALGVAEAMLRGLGARSLMALSASTGRALAALADGTLHAAVVHGRPGALPSSPLPVARLHLAKWQVGLGVSPALGRGSLEDVLEDDVPVIRREPAAASQQAFDRAARRIGRVPSGAGHQAAGHIEAARLAATLRGAAITNEGAARAFGLRFLALEEHTVEVWLDRRWLGHPGADALGDVLGTSAFTARVAQFGGYELSACGRRITD